MTQCYCQGIRRVVRSGNLRESEEQPNKLLHLSFVGCADTDNSLFDLFRRVLVAGDVGFSQGKQYYPPRVCHRKGTGGVLREIERLHRRRRWPVFSDDLLEGLKDLLQARFDRLRSVRADDAVATVTVPRALNVDDAVTGYSKSGIDPE